VKRRSVVVGIVFALALTVMTESVLLLGYVLAGASLVLMFAVMIRKVIRSLAIAPVPSPDTRSLDMNDREAA